MVPDNGPDPSAAGPSQSSRSALSRETIERSLRLQGATQGIALVGGWELDFRTRQLFWTAETYRILDVDPETFEPSVPQGVSFFTPESQDIINRALWEAENEGKSYDLELDLVTAKGRSIVVRMTGEVICDDGGAPLKLIGTIQDLSRLRQTEELLQQREKLLRAVYDHAAVGIGRMDAAGTWTDVNAQMMDLLGSDEGKILNRPVTDFIHAEYRWVIQEAIRAAREQRKPSTRLTARMRDRDGTKRWCDLSFGAMFEGTGPPRGFVVVVTDVTRRMVAESEARNSEQFQRAILDAMEEQVCVVNPQGNIAVVNRSWLSWPAFKDRGESTAGLYRNYSDVWQRAFGPDAAAAKQVPTMINEVIHGRHQQSGELEYTCSLPGQEMRWFRLNVTPLPEVAPRRVVILQTEITKDRKAERELQEAAQRISLATEIAGVGVWEWHVPSGKLTWDDQVFALHGLNPAVDALPTYDEWRTWVLPEDLPEQERILQHTIATKGFSRREFRFRRPNDQAERTLETNETTRLNDSGEVEWVLGTCLDITERKLAEQALADAAQRVKLATEIAGVGVWEWHVPTGEANWDDQMFAIYGLERPDDNRMTYELWRDRVLPEDLAQREEVLQHTAATKGRSSGEFRIRRADDGRVRIISSFETVRLNESGEVEWVVGSNVDITERTHERIALSRSRSRLRELNRRLLQVEESHSKRIAAQVHDELGQQLTGLKMDLRSMERQLEKTATLDRSALLEMAMAAGALVDETISTVQRISADLRPVLLDQLGLVAALQEEVFKLEKRAGIAGEVNLSDTRVNVLPEAVATGCYWIVREALTNVARHSQASRVTVSLQIVENRLKVDVTDDGVGIAPSVLGADESLGIIGMHERAEQMNGDVAFHPLSPKGTRVQLTIPLTDD